MRYEPKSCRSYVFTTIVGATVCLTGCSGEKTPKTSDTHAIGDHLTPERPKPLAGLAATAASTVPSQDCLAAAGGARDILGIKIGMAYADAKAILNCGTPDYKLSRQTLKYRPGDAELTRGWLIAATDKRSVRVTMVGKPGAERVWGVYRSTTFPKDAQPTYDQYIAGLTAQYGPLDYYAKNVRVDLPDRAVNKKVTDRFLPRIVRDAKDQQIVFGASQYEDCVSAINLAFDMVDMRYAKDCGFVVAAKIVPDETDPAKVRYAHILIGNPAQVISLLSQDDPSVDPGCTQNRMCQMLRKSGIPVS